MRHKLNTNTLKDKIYKLVGNEYSLISEYHDCYTKVIIKHNECGNSYPVLASSFLYGRRCPFCFGTRKKTTDDFKKEVFNLVGDEYSIIGEYVNAHTKIKICHNKCNTIFEMTPSNFLQGQRCSCDKYIRISNKNKKSQAVFLKEFKDLVGNEYDVLTSYKNALSKIKIKHNLCNNVFEMTPAKFLSGERCPYCAGCKLKTTEEYKSEIYNLVQDEYTVIGEYINSHTLIHIRHNKCNYEWDVDPSSFLFGHSRCPHCSSSKGEKEISKILKLYNITYIPQYKFKDCIYKSKLKFDFYLPKYNTCIEYQGIQHYEPIDFAGKGDNWANNQFNVNQIKDNIKRNYCNNKNILLIAIPYWDFNNIEDILSKNLIEDCEDVI